MITPPVLHFVNNGVQRCEYTPLARLVTDVTNAFEPTVTTSVDHEFSTGQFIRLLVPKIYGMSIDQIGEITVTGDTTFTITVNTQDSEAFVTPVVTNFTNAQAIADSGTWNNTGAP